MDEVKPKEPTFTPALILIVSLFLLWGMANNLNDTLIPQFRKAFTLTDLQSGLVQSAFYAGYFVFAIPASLFMQRFGYKAAVVFGLVLYAIGAFLFFPAAETHAYAFFLGALFVIASGLAFLETSANPLVTVLGSPDKAEQRLNFAQSFNPLGLLIGVAIGRTFILTDTRSPTEIAALSPDELQTYYQAQSHAVQGPYLVIGAFVLLWALVVLAVRFPAVATAHKDEAPQAGGFGALFGRPHFLLGVVAQFFYVAAQVGVWSFTIRYTQHVRPGTAEHDAANFLLLSIVFFTIGRFVGTALMGKVHPERLLGLYALAAMALTLIAALAGGDVGLYSLAGVSFFMSIMFPTIFASAIRGLGPLTKAGSSFLVMAIIGGALMAPLMGGISDASSMQTAMFAPAACFAVILAYALISRAPKAVAA
ncbi:MAG: L-fucose:H+ symporter permease [Pseudomonadota bacterium]